MKRPILFVTIAYIICIILFSQIEEVFFQKKHLPSKNIPVILIGTVDSEPSPSPDRQDFELKSKHILIGSKYRKISGRFNVFLFSKDQLRYGDIIKIKGEVLAANGPSNPNSFDYNKFLKNKEIAASIIVLASKGGSVEVLARDRGSWFISQSLRLKNRIMGVFDKTLPKDQASLLGSIIFGMKASPIPDEVSEKYRKAGVSHILVASGQQVSILTGVSLALLGAINMPMAVVSLITSVLIWCFTAMAGFGSSILRAAIMGQIMIFGIVFDRERDFITSMSFAALVLLIINPYTLFDIGFQLSFFATLSLVYAAPIIAEKLSQNMNKKLALSISLAIAPVLFTMPIAVYNFSQLTFVAFVSNMVVVPLAEVLTVLGFISSSAGLLFVPFAAAINGFNYILLLILDNSVTLFSSMPFANTFVARPSIVTIAIYYGVIISIIKLLNTGDLKKWMIRVKPVCVVLFCLFVASQTLFAGKDLNVTFVDVGQGDCALLEMPNGQKVLIDGGGKASNDDKVGAKIVVPFLHSKGINKLDLVILTHPHDDHVGGLVSVLKEIKVDEVLDSGQPQVSRSYIKFLTLIKNKNIKYHIALAGQVLNFGDVKGYVLWPTENHITGTISDLNNNSIVIKYIYGKTSFLMVGDLAFEGENEIMGMGVDLKSDVLKVGHHGSATSTSAEFLDMVSPSYAVISVGANNTFGHPNQYTLKRLEERGIKVFRTDLDGAIEFSSDGERIRIRPLL